MKEHKGPLNGIKVLSIGTSIVGPWAATLMGYLGAEVFKVEPPKGEFLRMLYPHQNKIATAYSSTNLNQKSAGLNTKEEEGMNAMLGLANQADILIENFRPGVAERIGLGYETLHESNPNLVFGSSSGYGDDGPMKNLAALEPHLQAFSGMSGVTGYVDGDGQLIRFTHLDPTGAVFFCGLLMLGLIERERFGHSCWVKTSHLANAIANMNNKVSDLFGDIKLNANKYLDFGYNFSLDNDFETLNYNMIDSTLSINNFVTTFEFLEENNELGSTTYLLNETSLALDSNSKILFRQRTNKET